MSGVIISASAALRSIASPKSGEDDTIYVIVAVGSR
jgi:hypothetical protein